MSLTVSVDFQTLQIELVIDVLCEVLSFPTKVIISNFSRMRSEGSRFIWGSGGEAVFAESCVYVRNRPQPSATVRNRLCVRRKALHSGECVWSGPESVSH